MRPTPPATSDFDIHDLTVGDDIPWVIVEGIVLIPEGPFPELTGGGALQAHIFLDDPNGDVPGQAGHRVDLAVCPIQRRVRLGPHQRPNARNIRAVQERRHRGLVPKMHRGVVLRHRIGVHFLVVRFVGEHLVHPQNLDYVGEIGDKRADGCLDDRTLFPQFID
jgi:hypothetical protein